MKWSGKILSMEWEALDIESGKGLRNVARSHEQISEYFCFIALCLSFATYSYLLVQREIPSRIFGSHPSESDENIPS